MRLSRDRPPNYCGKTDHITVPDPDAQYEAIRDALAQSGVDPGTVSYVELSGAGTLLGDFAEARALEKAFGASSETDGDLLVGSVKTNIGNLEAASGIAGVIRVVLAMKPQNDLAHASFRKGKPVRQVEGNALFRFVLKSGNGKEFSNLFEPG